jgi:beta-glucuronidase
VLRPRDTPTRKRRALNQAVAGPVRRRWHPPRRRLVRRPLRDAREVPRAASCSDLFADERVRGHVGDAQYQITVRVPAGRAERRR